MPSPLVPKLKIPLQLSGTGFAVVEQGSVDEVAQCVYAITATPLGSRIDDMEFGVEDPSFEQLPLDVSEILSQVRTFEPAAKVEVVQEVEEARDRVVLGVSL